MKKLSHSSWGLYLGLILVMGIVTAGLAEAQTDDENNDDWFFEDDLQHAPIYQSSLQQGTLQPGPLQPDSFPQSFAQQGFAQQGFAQQGFTQPSDLQPGWSPNGYTPRDPFSSPGPYLGPADPLSQNNFQQRWQPLSFNTDLHRLRPLVISTARLPSGNIPTTPLDFPEDDLQGSNPDAAAPIHPPPASSTTPAARPRKALPPTRQSSTGQSSTRQSSTRQSSTTPGRLTFSVHPADTRVLVNDELLGTGGSLSAAAVPEALKPGIYAIEAEHDRYETERLMFSLTAGDNLHVVIDLTAKDADRGRVDKVN